MKKFIAILASFALALSALAFTACTTEENIGVVEGNYVEADVETLNSALAKVDFDVEEIAQGAGLDFAAKSAFSLDVPDMYAANGAIDVGYKLKASTESEALNLAGAGSGSVSFNVTAGNTKTEGKYSANVYNDAQFVYFDANIGEPVQGKIDVLKLMEDSVGGLPGDGDYPDVDLPDAGADLPATLIPDINELVVQLEAMGVKVYIDDGNGLKIKISLTTEVVQNLLNKAIEEAAGTDAALDQMLEIVKLLTLTNVRADFYFVFDAEGKFVQFSEDIEVAATMKSEAGVIQAPDVTFNLKSSAYVKAYSGEVTLPEAIKDYPDMTDDMTNPPIIM